MNMEKNKNKGKAEKTGSEALNGTNRLHFLQNFRASKDIRQGTKSYNTSFYTNTFNKIPSFCQDFTGVYRRFRNTIKLSSSLILKIQERKHVTGNKSKMYLNLYKKVGNKLIFQDYISGLKEVKGIENLYRFDYWLKGRKVYYLMALTDTTAKITKIPDFLPLYTNRGKK
jgi:hypothetical protein